MFERELANEISIYRGQTVSTCCESLVFYLAREISLLINLSTDEEFRIASSELR